MYLQSGVVNNYCRELIKNSRFWAMRWIGLPIFFQITFLHFYVVQYSALMCFLDVFSPFYIPGHVPVVYEMNLQIVHIFEHMLTDRH